MKKYEAPVVEITEFEAEVMLTELFNNIFTDNRSGIEDGGNI